MKSKLFTLDLRDLLNGLLIAFLAALIDGVIKLLGSGVDFDWAHIQPILIAGISAALAYFLKSLSTNSRNQLFTKEPG
jgi:predicted Co/Zn/Cd cation transporter (cation efflux family)